MINNIIIVLRQRLNRQERKKIERYQYTILLLLLLFYVPENLTTHKSKRLHDIRGIDHILEFAFIHSQEIVPANHRYYYYYYLLHSTYLSCMLFGYSS